MEPSAAQQAYTSMMKFTIDGRPYLKDIHDLFAALIVQIPLDTHRYLFRSYFNTFTSEDAIQALGSLKFTHSLRTPDSSDPTKHVRTTTTTTFNMAREMAKALCQQFQNCRLMENAVDSNNRSFRDKGIWNLTPKGLCVLQDFCVRTEVDMTSLRKYFSHIEPIQLIKIDRHTDDDQLMIGRQNMSVIFKVMMTSLPVDGDLERGTASSASSGSKPAPSSSSASSTSSATSSSTPSSAAPFAMSSQASNGDSRVQLLGNYLLTLSKSGKQTQLRTAKTMRLVFSTQMCCDWLLDYSTVVSREESETMATEFLKYNWIEFQDPKNTAPQIKVSKSIMVVVTREGRKIVAGTDSKSRTTSVVPAQSPTTEDTASQDEKQATLHEILSQGPELASNSQKYTTITTTTTTTTSTSQSNELVDRSQAPQLPPLHHMDMSRAVARTPSLGGGSNTSNDKSVLQDKGNMDSKESNYARLKFILNDAQLRSLFKDFLRTNFCEENLDFWIDYSTLRRKCRNQSPALPSQNQKDLLEDAYDIWSTYLKPGAPSELNVDHSLRQELARLVNAMVTAVPTSYTPGQAKTAYVISTSSVSQSLRMMLKWFDRVDDHIKRLMASDSVPKFVKTDSYRKLQETRDRELKRESITLSKDDLLFSTDLEN